MYCTVDLKVILFPFLQNIFNDGLMVSLSAYSPCGSPQSNAQTWHCSIGRSAASHAHPVTPCPSFFRFQRAVVLCSLWFYSSMPSISLSSNPAIQSSDDSGLLISKRALPLYYHGPYTQDLLPYDKRALPSLDYVAPLEYYCIKCLLLHVDQLDLEGAPRIIFDMNARGQLRLMKTLMPFFSQRMRPSHMKFVDPRLWASLIQLFTHLPPAFRSYSLPLSDMYLPLLQIVKSSVDFTLITILDLSCETNLTDDTIGQLKPLTNICVLDISSTKVSTWGIKQLSMCLTRDEASGVRFGPWNIRILSMKDCRRIRDDVKPILQKFPLLAVIGMSSVE